MGKETGGRREIGSRPELYVRLNGWADLIFKPLALIAIVIGALQYFGARERDRVDRSMGFVERFSSGPVGDAQRVIAGELDELEPAVEDYNAAGLNEEGARAAHLELVRFVVEESRKGQGLRAEMQTVISFLDAVETCIEARICDGPTARSFFSPYARRLIQNFSPLILERRARTPDYAVLTERLATQRER
jgi:hypothetical protein